MDSDTEHWIKVAIDDGVKEAKNDFEMPVIGWQKWKRWVAGWLRKGYHDAVLRYGKDRSDELTNVYRAMEKQLNKVLFFGVEGEFVHVDFDEVTLEWKTEVISFDDPEHPDYEEIEEIF